MDMGRDSDLIIMIEIYLDKVNLQSVKLIVELILTTIRIDGKFGSIYSTSTSTIIDISTVTKL